MIRRSTEQELTDATGLSYIGKRKNDISPIGKSKWPLCTMDVGDMLECYQGDYGKADVTKYPHKFGAKRGWKFSVRRQDNGMYHIIRTS